MQEALSVEKMKSSVEDRWDQETILVAQIASVISFLSFLYYLHQDEILLYGDVFGHINIARRIFDSRTPGLLQLGTVWLPLPHLLMFPFQLSDWMWQTGAGGSIPSLIADVFAVVGIFRLVRGSLSATATPNVAARRTAWLSVGIFATNPNLIYMQATAMTEALYLAFSIWAIVHFAEFVKYRKSAMPERETSRSLIKAGLCLFATCLVRYDGWFLAAAIVIALLVLITFDRDSPVQRATVIQFILLTAAAPILWIGYNAVFYRNPLEFANGPYSAKGLARKDAAAGTAPYPGANSLPVASIFFAKSAELNMANGDWGRLWLAATFAGLLILLLKYRRRWVLLLLLVPLPFYALSIAYGGVAIYLPVWWPHGFYNVRYGLELLPAFAVFVALASHQALAAISNRNIRTPLMVVILGVIALSYGTVWRAQPICLQEALRNSHTRTALETALADNLKMLPPNSSLLMYLGDHVGALQRADFPIRHVIDEGNTRPWMKPSDPSSLWEAALTDPARYVDYVIAVDGDPVATRVNHQQLVSLVVIHVTGEPSATIYSTPRASSGNLLR